MLLRGVVDDVTALAANPAQVAVGVAKQKAGVVMRTCDRSGEVMPGALRDQSTTIRLFILPITNTSATKLPILFRSRSPV